MLINNDTILKDTNPLLREKSQLVDLPLSSEDEQLLTDMLNYVIDSTDEEKAEKYNLRPAVGISAVQVGVLKRMTAIAFDEENADGNIHSTRFMLVNPKIVSSSVQQAYLRSGEGCLSVENEHAGFVPRSARIKVRAYDHIRKQHVEIKASGYLAIVLQHELDHFEGILFYDHINKEDPFTPIENALEI